MKKVFAIGSALCLSLLLLGATTSSAASTNTDKCIPINKPCKIQN